MPELPEVQTTVNGLNARIRGLVIADAWTDYGGAYHRGSDTIKDAAYFKKFTAAVIGARVIRTDRIAKNILIHIEKRAPRTGAKRGIRQHVILIHMKMTGHMMYGRYVFGQGGLNKNRVEKTSAVAGEWRPAPGERPSLSDPFNRFVHFALTFSNGHQLVLSDMRKFAKVALIDEGELGGTAHLADIGPDPLAKGFSFGTFRERLMRRPTGKVKQVLMDQSVIAGVGNIYGDEALWRAGIHPLERVGNISDVVLKRLYTALVRVLRNGIDFGGDSMSDYRNIDGERGRFQEQHRAYRRTGERCLKPGCGGTIRRIVIGTRSAHYCDRHQRLVGTNPKATSSSKA